MIGVVLALAGFACAWLMFLRGGLGAETLEAETSLPVPEHTVSADKQTSRAALSAKANPRQLEGILRRAARRAGARVAEAKEREDGRLEAKLRCRPEQVFALMAALDRNVGFRRGGQLRASGRVALVESLGARSEDGRAEVSLVLRSV